MDKSLFNIEVTAEAGGNKWIKDIVSHTEEEIKALWKNGDMVEIKSKDGGESVVDMERVFFIRFQDGKVFEDRSRRIQAK